MLTNQTIDPTKVGEPKPNVLLRPFIAVWQWLVPPTQAHSDRQSKTARWVAGSLIAIVSGTLITLAVMYAKPIQDSYQDWQAEKLVKDARQLAADGQFLDAAVKAQNAVMMAPENINAVRLNAEILTAARRNEAIYFLEKLEKLQASTDSDKQLKVRALLNLNRNKEASQSLEDLLANAPASEAMMKLAEDVWGVRQQDSTLLNVLKRYARRHPDDKANLIRLAKVQVSTNNPQEVTAGIKLAWEVAAEEDANGMSAIEFLDTVGNLSVEDSNRLIQRLENHPNSNGWHKVAAMKRKLQLKPGRRQEIVLEAMNLAKGKEREELLPLVRWFVEQREFLPVLTLVTETQAKQYQPLLENYLNALTALGRYPDMERLIEDPDVIAMIPKSVATFYRAHLAYVMRKPAEEIRSAVLAAKQAAEQEGRAELILAIAKYAEERGHTDIAEEAYKSASASRRTERDGYHGLIRVSEVNGNTESMLVAAREAAHRWPDDQSYRERYLYACLLTGKDLELSLDMTRKLLEAQPKDNLRKLMVSLGYWRVGDMPQSAANLQHMDLNLLNNGQRAVFAMLARSAGFESEAKSVVNVIDPKARMLPEEGNFFKQAAR